MTETEARLEAQIQRLEGRVQDLEKQIQDLTTQLSTVGTIGEPDIITTAPVFEGSGEVPKPSKKKKR